MKDPNTKEDKMDLLLDLMGEMLYETAHDKESKEHIRLTMILRKIVTAAHSIMEKNMEEDISVEDVKKYIKILEPLQKVIQAVSEGGEVNVSEYTD